MYFDDVWIGYLCEQIIRQTEQLAKLKCSGCESKLKSPLLHLHEQQSLLDKLHVYFEDVRGGVAAAIPQFYDQIQHRLPHTPDLDQDRNCYISNAQQFLITVTSDALYYGRYMNEFIDGIVNEFFTVNKKRKSPTNRQSSKIKSKSPNCNQLNQL